jgi:hypothetical protein
VVHSIEALSRDLSGPDNEDQVPEEREIVVAHGENEPTLFAGMQSRQRDRTFPIDYSR